MQCGQVIFHNFNITFSMTNFASVILAMLNRNSAAILGKPIEVNLFLVNHPRDKQCLSKCHNFESLIFCL